MCSIPRGRGRLLALLAALSTVACGPSTEDAIDDLSGDAEDRGRAHQELLLAKDRAVEPLLAALDDPERAAARLQLVDVLVGLTMRVDDDRILAALARHLDSDPSPAVRARIARVLGMYRRLEGLEALMAALDDANGDVRHQALLALGALDDKLTEEQRAAVGRRAAVLLGDPHPGVHTEARIRVESAVGDLLREAGQAVLSAETTRAESLLAAAVARAPTSKRAHYRLARYHYDYGDRDRGLDLLRRHGMLLDVPRLDAPPRLDGTLDDGAWEVAARADSFYVMSNQHPVALPASRPTRLYMGYTPEALYIGVWCYDEHPDSLVAKVQPAQAGAQEGIDFRQSIWTDDVIELFLDADFDHRDYAHIGINSVPAASPEWISGPRMEARSPGDWADDTWRPDDELATHVGADFWSLECRLGFEPERLPRPDPGDVWGFNAVRTFRGQEYNQWTRTYGGGHSPDDFGVLLFR